MIIKFKNKIINLHDWARVEGFVDNWSRGSNPNGAAYGTSVVLMLTYGPVLQEWYVIFFGDLAGLEEIYYRFYPTRPVFDKEELYKAQQHVDDFLKKYNNLLSFL